MTVVVDASWRGAPYQLNGPYLWVEVHGEPAPQGSKTPKGRTRTGRIVLVESSKAVRPWRAQVQAAVEDEMRSRDRRFGAGSPLCPWPAEGPVALALTFTMRKPKSAPKRRRTFPKSRPDVDKLARAVLDAVTAAGLIRDDSQVVELRARKVFPGESLGALPVPGLHLSFYLVSDGGEQS